MTNTGIPGPAGENLRVFEDRLGRALGGTERLGQFQSYGHLFRGGLQDFAIGRNRARKVFFRHQFIGALKCCNRVRLHGGCGEDAAGTQNRRILNRCVSNTAEHDNTSCPNTLCGHSDLAHLYRPKWGIEVFPNFKYRRSGD